MTAPTAPAAPRQLVSPDEIFEAGAQAAAALPPMSPAMAQRLAALLGAHLREQCFPPESGRGAA